MDNLSWLPDDGGTGHMPVNKDAYDIWKTIKEITDFKLLMEIGFNAGHSSSMILSMFDDVKVDSYDIGQFEITEQNGSLVEKRFPDRFSLTIIDSMNLKPEQINGKYDILFIDGSHDYPQVSSDIRLFLQSDIQYVVLDDLQNKNVQKAYTELLYNDRHEILFEETYQAVLPYAKRNTNKKQVKVPIRLVRKV